MARISKSDKARGVYNAIRLDRSQLIRRVSQMAPTLAGPNLGIGEIADSKIIWNNNHRDKLQIFAEFAEENTVSLAAMAEAELFTSWANYRLKNAQSDIVHREVVSKDISLLTTDDLTLLAGMRSFNIADFRNTIIAVAIFEMTDKFKHFYEPPQISEPPETKRTTTTDEMCIRFRKLLMERPAVVRQAEIFLKRYNA